jgi:hypothetical protein
MSEQKTAAHPGNGSCVGRIINYPHCTTPLMKIQPLDDLLDQAARRMGAADLMGDDAGYVNHFSIWLELHSLKRRWAR